MNRKILRIAGPSILANITVPLVGMADLAIAGHIGDATYIGAMAIATMLFDLLYWNMGFLRVGTGGFTAQAYGRRNFREAMEVFSQGTGTALAIAAVILILQHAYIETALAITDGSPEMEKMTKEYFRIRIWAAPATLSLFVFKGWFIGMQNSISPMVVDLTVNTVNIVASILLAVNAGMGFSGIAAGTLIAQYSGLLLSAFIMAKYYRKLLPYIDFRKSMVIGKMKRFLKVNSDLLVRSSCLLAIYSGFTVLSENYGEVQLSAGAVMMKMMLLFSYFIDGFAYAGEALTGKFIGSGDRISLKKMSKALFVWCFIIGTLSTAMYGFAGDDIFRLLTPDPTVIDASSEYMHWLLIMPIISCMAFTWDGIYIGASASAPIRKCMLLSMAGFFLTYYAGRMFMPGMHALWAGFAVHLAVRTLYLTAVSGRRIFSEPFSEIRSRIS